jgi:hypothetical protein
MEEKAKYIESKELTLFNDLDKAGKKMSTIANWYSFSNYKTNATDEKNFKLFVLKVNNIYASLRAILLQTKQLKLYEKLPQLISDGRLNDLSELELKRIESQKNKSEQQELLQALKDLWSVRSTPWTGK